MKSRAHGSLRWLGVLLVALLYAAPALAKDTVYFYYIDTLHSTVVETDDKGNVLERTTYAPYGQVLNRALRDGPGYTGHEEDAATGLVYMQQRYYDPQSGRFISTDPVQMTANGGNFNRYAYAQDNPYRFTDPFGLLPCEYVWPCNEADPGHRTPFVTPPSEMQERIVRAQQHSDAQPSLTTQGSGKFAGGAALAATGVCAAAEPCGAAEVLTALSVVSFAAIVDVASTHKRNPAVLFHYTTSQGMMGIIESGVINPSLRAVNPNDARYGNGQYFTDIFPGSMTGAQLSRSLVGMPFAGNRFTNFVAVDVSGLQVLNPRPHVYLVPNESPLYIRVRLIFAGPN